MELIDKSAVVEEIKRLIESPILYKSERVETRFNVLEYLLSFIDTLEVKDVDFDEEYIEEIYSHIDGIRDTADRMTSGNFMHHRAAIKFSANVIEKVLGLIGLKARNEE